MNYMKSLNPPQKKYSIPKEEKKPLIVGILAIAALIIFVFFSFFPGKLVGEAISASTSAGYTLEITSRENEFNISANILDNKTNGIYFVLESITPGFSICSSNQLPTTTTSLGWLYQDSYCEADKLIFSAADLDNASFKTGRFDVAILTDISNIPEIVSLKFTSLEMLDTLNGLNMFPETVEINNIQRVVTPSEDDRDEDGGEEDGEEDGDSQDGDEVSPSQQGGSGGGCVSEWKCDSWSLCNSTLQQSRVCDDVRCNKKDKIEVKTCNLCQESWVCSIWDECKNGLQIRKCVDEHQCMTNLYRPEEKRSCSLTIPAQIIMNAPLAGQPKPFEPAVQPPVGTKGFERYYISLLVVGIAFALLITVLLILLFLRHKTTDNYNYNELKEWIKKERRLRTSDSEIKSMLRNTEWTSKDIARVMKELSSKFS